MNKMVESEKLIERYLFDQVKQRKGLCIKLLTNHLLGLPDRLCLLPKGRLFFAEIKTTGFKPNKIQVYMHNKIIQLGFKVYIIDTKKNVDEIIKEYEKVIYD